MFWVVDSLMMRKYKLMKCLDDSCDSAAEKGNADESQVRRDQAGVCPDGLVVCLPARPQKHPSVQEAEEDKTAAA